VLAKGADHEAGEDAFADAFGAAHDDGDFGGFGWVLEQSGAPVEQIFVMCGVTGAGDFCGHAVASTTSRREQARR